MNAPGPLLLLHDLDQLLTEWRDPVLLARLRRAGLECRGVEPIEKARARLLHHLDARWRHQYERAHRRYGTAVAPVRGRVCQGCFMALPRSAAPASPDAISVCESCGRILYWGRPDTL